MAGKSFNPWRLNHLAAAFFILAAIAIPSAGVVSGFPPIPMITFAAFMLYQAWSQWQRGKARRFGKSFEGTYIRQAMAILGQYPHFQIHANVEMRSGEDIDLVVEWGNDAIPIEIKSYRYWSTFLFGWHFGREKRAIKQAKRQARALGTSHGIIWLPQGQRSFWLNFARVPKVGGNVYLVFGNAEALAEVIHNL